MDDDKIVIDGKEYIIPEHIKSPNGSCQEMINGRIYLNGYRFYPETGEWKLSPRKFIDPFKVIGYIVLVGALLFVGYLAISHLSVSWR